MALPTAFKLKPAAPTANAAHQGDTAFLPFMPAPEWPETLIYYENAAKLAQRLALTPGAGAYVFVNGSFIFGDFIEAFIVHHNYHVKELLIATLSIKQDNIDSLHNLLAGGYVDKLSFVLADYSFSHNRWTLMPYLVEQLGYDGRAEDGRFTFAAAGTHCKICLIETHCGRRFVLHGSANLVSSGNIEQFEIEDNPVKYAFNHRYLTALLTRYNVLNRKRPDIRQHKPLTKTQTWQPTKELPAPAPLSSTPTAAPAKPLPAAAARNAAPAPASTPALPPSKPPIAVEKH